VTTKVQHRGQKGFSAKRPDQSVLSMRVEPELKERVHAAAAANRTTVSAMLRDVLERKLDGFALVGVTGDGPAAVEFTTDPTTVNLTEQGGEPLQELDVAG
jgi:predicted DNA-binding protein